MYLGNLKFADIIQMHRLSRSFGLEEQDKSDNTKPFDQNAVSDCSDT